MLQYFGWWLAIAVVPAAFLDHHRCEAKLPYFAWILYAATVLAMTSMAILLELSVVQRLGLLQAGELSHLLQEKRWRVPLIATAFWKLDSYTDIAFIFIACDCGSSLWWASLATVIFAVFFCQIVFNSCFACTDCDHELPKSFGFILMDFKLVNAAVRHVLPFDPDASDLPFAKPVTIRNSGHLVGLEKVISDIAQVSIQCLFLVNVAVPHGFVIFSVLVGICNGALSLSLVIQECLRQEWDSQNASFQQGTALLPPSQEVALAGLPHGSQISSTAIVSSRGISSNAAQATKQEPRPTKYGAPWDTSRHDEYLSRSNGSLKVADGDSDTIDLL